MSNHSSEPEDAVPEEQRVREFLTHRNQGNILFVGNLPFQTPWQNVKDQFRRAGKVRYTDLVADREGRPKGSALVTMMTGEGAQRAIQMFNETDFEGRRLIVRQFDDGPRPPLVQRNLMPAYSRQNNNRPVPFTGGFQQQHRPQAIGGDFNGTGGYTGRGGAQHGRGAVQQHAQQHQQQHQQQQQQQQPQQHNADAERVPKPRSQQIPEADRKLFVSNLPFDCTGSALTMTFQQIGVVERSEIIVGRNGKSRGMGIVVMASPEDARVAIAEFDGIEMAGRAMNVRLDSKP